jgi:hypothetical protein
MLTLTQPEKFTPREKTEVDKLRDRLNELVGGLVAFPPDMVGRAMLARAAALILSADGMNPAIWSVQRVEHLLAGQFTNETVELFIRAPNH